MAGDSARLIDINLLSREGAGNRPFSFLVCSRNARAGKIARKGVDYGKAEDEREFIEGAGREPA